MTQLTNTQIAYQTQYTRTGERNMQNRKPYRTPRQKNEARKVARKIDGRYVSSAPVSYHK